MLDESGFGFRLRVPDGWSIDVDTEDGPMMSWRMHRDAWVAGGVPKGLLALNVTVIEPEPGQNVEADFAGFVRNYADKYLEGGEVGALKAFRFGAHPGFSSLVKGRIKRPSGDVVKVTARAFIYMTDDRQVIVTAVAPRGSAQALDQLGEPGALLEAATTSDTEPPAGDAKPGPEATATAEPADVILPDPRNRLRGVSWGGGSLEEFGRLDGDGLEIVLPPGAGTGGVGVASRGTPVVLGDLEGGDATTLRLSLRTAETNLMLLVLCPGEMVPCISEPGLYLHLASTAAGARLVIGSEGVTLAEATLPAMPEHLALRIDRDGVYLFPSGGDALLTARPAALASFAALNVLVAATPMDTGTRLRIASLSVQAKRFAAGESIPAPDSMAAVLPSSKPGAWLETAANGGDFAAFATLDDRGLVVNVPQGRSWGITGIVSANPLVGLADGSDPAQGYRLHGVVNPGSSNAFAIAILPEAQSDVWLSSIAYADMYRTADGRKRIRLYSCGSSIRVAEAFSSDAWDGAFDLVLLPDRIRFMVGDQALSAPLLACRVPETGAHVAVFAAAGQENEAASLHLSRLAIDRVGPVAEGMSGSTGPDAAFRADDWIAETAADLLEADNDR